MEFDFDQLGIEDNSALDEALERRRGYSEQSDVDEVEDVVEETLAEAESESEAEEDIDLNQIDQRLEVASFYRALLKNPLFGNSRNAASNAVEKEVRAFCKARLENLMGVPNKSSPIKSDPRESVKLPFTSDQVDALTQLANTLINKSKVQITPTVVPAKVTEPVVNPVNIQPAPKPRTATLPARQPTKQPVKSSATPVKGATKKAPRKALFQEKENSLGITDEDGNVVKMKKQLVQKPAGMAPMPANMYQANLNMSAQQVAKAEKGMGAGSLLFNKIITHHTAGGNTGE